MPDRIKLAVDSKTSVSLLKSGRMTGAEWLFIYAPGAGSGLHDPFGAFLAERLPANAVECWRFQFPYMEAGRRGPDRPPVLEETWRAALAEAAGTGLRVVAGGRSMGGRIASQVVAQGADADALALFAYPLHPPGKPDDLRVAHLPSIQLPVLFCSGTRDTFASPSELTDAAALVPQSTVHFLDGADHGFTTLKSAGRTRQEVWAEASAALLSFLADK